MNATDRIRQLFRRIHNGNDESQFVDGLLATNIAVRGRANYKYVSLPGNQPPVPARDDVGVPESPGLSVRMKVSNIVEGSGVKTYTIVAINRREDLATVTPPPSSGVPVHHHDPRYFQKTEHIDASAGAADAGKPVKTGATGQFDPSLIDLSGVDVGAVIDAAPEQTTPEAANAFPLTDTGVLKWISWTNILAALGALFEAIGAVATHAALTVTHGATGAVVGTTNSQVLTNKTLTAPVIADLTNMAHDHGDADDGGNIPYTSVTGGPTQYTDELAQDAVGTILTDTATIDLDYADATPAITATVKDDSITYAKMQNIATDSLIGRDTASTGDPETIGLNATLSMTGAGALQRAALTGDVTAPAGSNATTIANDAVTFAKMQNIATDSLLGRFNSGSGDIELITITAYARGLIDDIDAAAARATLGLDAVYGRLAAANTWSVAQTFSAGASLLFTDPDVVHPVTGVLPTNQYGNIGHASGTLGGLGLVGITDADGNAMFYWAINGATNPADTTPAHLFRADRSNGGTGVAALAAAETHSAWDNSGTRILRMLGDGSLLMVNGATLTVETLKAVDASGLIFQDDSGATGIILEDATLKLLLNGLTSAGASALAIKPGTSANDAAVGGVIHVDVASNGNAATSLATLKTYSVPANTLAVNGQSFWFEASGTIANGATAAQLHVDFGGDTLGDSLAATTVTTDGFWIMRGRIYRTGATTQKSFVEFNVQDGVGGGAGGCLINLDYATQSRTLSSANDLRIRVTTDGTVNDVVMEMFTVGWQDANV